MSIDATDIALEIREVLNTVATVLIESVVVSTDSGNIITIGTENTVLVESPNSSVIITGIIGPVGPIGISEDDIMYSKRVDFITDNELYRGEASVGSSESSAVWRIRKIVIGIDGDVSEKWASGNANFDKVWSDRLILTYI
jgi:hypothetical protein